MLFNFLGAYDNGYTYSYRDAVEFNGSTYVMMNFIGAAGYDPVAYPGNWTLVVSKGADGAPGPAGPAGADGLPGSPAAPMQSMGTWGYGTYYSTSNIVVYNGVVYLVNNNHTSSMTPDQDTYNYTPLPALTGPQGPQGDAGPQGPQGAGVSAGDARIQSIADIVRQSINDATIGINSNNDFSFDLISGCMIKSVINGEFNPSGKWFGVMYMSSVVPASVVTNNNSNQHVTMAFNLGMTFPNTGTGLFYTEDGGVTWFESTFKL